MPRNKKNKKANANAKIMAKALQAANSRVVANRNAMALVEAVEQKTPNSQGAGGMRSGVITAAPVSFSKRMGFGGSNGKSNSFRVQKREYITTLNGSVNFSAAYNYNINPGLEESFPWLWETAVKWQQYKFYKFRVLYVSRSSTASTGSVIISPEYNISDGIPTNKREALDTQDAVTDATWKELQCDMDITAMFGIGPRNQVRKGPISSDLATYDCAIVSLCTDGQSSTSPIGEIWFEYDVEFFVPQSTPLGTQLSQKCNVYSLTSDVVATTGASTLLSAFTLQGNNNPLNILQGSPGYFSIPEGTFRIDFYLAGVWPGTSVSASAIEAQIYESGNPLAVAKNNSVAGTAGYGGAVSFCCTMIFVSSNQGAVTFNAQYTNSVGFNLLVKANETFIVITIL